MNKRKLLAWFLQSPEGDPAAGSGGGGGGDPASPAAGGPAAGAAPGGGDGGDPAGGTALAAGAEGGTPEPVTMPEKFIVKKEDGTIDHEASSLKMAEAYSNLEKRAGSGDLPPKTVEEYAIAVPDELKDTWKPGEDPLLQEFLKGAHEAGYSQKQVDFAMKSYMNMLPSMIKAGTELDAEACTTALKAEWKTEDEYKANIGKAYKAAVGYFGNDAESMIKEYGNDPRFIRGMAKLGSEMGEDSSLNFDGKAAQESIDTLMASKAYTNPKDPDHAKVSAQVSAYFQKKAAAEDKAGSAAII